ncbi:MAG: cyclic nucleotide-binding domain-containing protein [Deltaproteobacteria bacterium]|nr:cyclic nucleotide-binding domain-containing protein [Deltaproteobacteria bacterium]
MSTRKPDLNQLRLVRMFNELGDADIDALRASLRFRELEVPEIAWTQGDPGDFLVVICHGRLGVYARNGDGPDIELGQSGAGEILGEMACIDPSPRSATVAALEPTLVGELSRDALRMLREYAPNVYATVMTGVIGDVTRRLREIDAKLEDAQGKPKLEPVAGAPSASPGEEAKDRSEIWRLVSRWMGDR